jgi:lipid II:glycine glycyltransferase (peptidoglycan interpeptide bridge formation enzyme)
MNSNDDEITKLKLEIEKLRTELEHVKKELEKQQTFHADEIRKHHRKQEKFHHEHNQSLARNNWLTMGGSVMTILVSGIAYYISHLKKSDIPKLVEVAKRTQCDSCKEKEGAKS